MPLTRCSSLKKARAYSPWLVLRPVTWADGPGWYEFAPLALRDGSHGTTALFRRRGRRRPRARSRLLCPSPRKTLTKKNKIDYDHADEKD